MNSKHKEFRTFEEFYPFYLQEHSHPLCRALHYTGSSLVIFVLLYALISQQLLLLWLLPVLGYGFAWVGHFFVEKNRPATFTYPLYSFIADWVMLKDFLTGKLKDKHPAIND
jgi:hypothetical protein